MTTNSQEFIDMRKQFEENLKSLPGNHSCDITRDNSGVKGVYYANGLTNALFRAFQYGYSSGRCNYLNQ